VDESTTNRFKLPDKGYLSGLYLKLKQTNAANNAALDERWPFQQTSLRIIGNGNVEIINLRGRQLEAINFWDTGEMPKNNLNDVGGGVQEAYAFIPFGRYLGDPKYGLILEKFGAGVEFEDSNTFSTTYFTDAYNKYDIMALMRKDPEPGLFSGGFLKKKQVFKRDANTETQVPYMIPTENKIRNIYLFDEPSLSSHLPATTPFTLMSSVWLGIKSKEEYLLDNMDTTTYARAIYQMMKRKVHTSGLTMSLSATDNYFDTMIYEREGTHLTLPYTTGGFASEYTYSFWERICQNYAWTATATRVVSYLYVDAWGILYHGLIPLMATDPMADETEFLDSKALRTVYVEFTEGSSSGYIYGVVDELEKAYPS
jgi:hypothetical protein